MTKRLRDCSVTVVGLGLMGASLCMDLKSGGLCREVRGVARRTQTVLDAFFAGAVDLATNDLHTGILGADIVVLANCTRIATASTSNLTCLSIAHTCWTSIERRISTKINNVTRILINNLMASLEKKSWIFCLLTDTECLVNR